MLSLSLSLSLSPLSLSLSPLSLSLSLFLFLVFVCPSPSARAALASQWNLCLRKDISHGGDRADEINKRLQTLAVDMDSGPAANTSLGFIQKRTTIHDS